jgi:hypothetical protein
MKKIIGLLLVGMLLLLVGSVFGQEVGILGVELGETLLSCKEAEGKRPCYHAGAIYHEVLFYPEHGLGDVRVKLDSDKRVVLISLAFDSESKGDLVLELCEGKFGKPHKIKKAPVTNRMGVVFDNIEAIWVTKGHKILYSKRSSAVNRGTLDLIRKDEAQRMEEEFKKIDKDLKKRF